MRCLRCKKETKVTETRKKGAFIVKRKRKCISCGYQFTTIEKILPLKIWVKKRDGRIEPFSEQKLERGLKKAFTKRPIKNDEFENLIEKIKDEIRRKENKQISTKEIGQIVMENIKNIDVVAYLRFASIYKNFGSLNSFEKEIKKLKKTKWQKTKS